MTSNKTLVYDYTYEDAHDQLKLKGIDPEWLKKEFEHKSLKSLAKDVNIGHVRLRYILKALGVSTEKAKSSKIGSNNSKNATINRASLLKGTDLDSLKKEYIKFGKSYCQDKYGDKVVFAFLAENKVRSPHGSSVRSKKIHEEIENSFGEEINFMVSANIPIDRISRKLGIKASSLKSYFKVRYPDYQGTAILTDDDKKELAKKLSKSGKIISQKTKQKDYDILENFPQEELLLNFTQKLIGVQSFAKGNGLYYNNVISYLKDKFDYDYVDTSQMRNLIASNCNIDDDHIYLSSLMEKFKNENNIVVPREFVDFYSAPYVERFVLMDQLLLESYIRVNSFCSLKELAASFRYISLNSLRILINDYDLNDAFIKLSEEDKILQLVSNYTDWKDFDSFEEYICNTKWKTFSHFREEFGLSYLLANRVLDYFEYNKKFLLSSPEAKISDLLDVLKIKHSYHRRDILMSGKELDLYIDDLRIGIEVNPTYTHNNTTSPYSQGVVRNKDYHYKKFLDAEKTGVKLIQFYDRDLIEPLWSNVTVPFLKFKLLGADRVLYGRQISIEKITVKKDLTFARDFIEKYHAQGMISAKYYYSFKYKDEVIGVASFSPVRSKNVIELKRLVFLPGTQVRYGLSKLISQVSEDFQTYEKFISFSRNDMGNGFAYKQAGFSFVKETGPTLYFESWSDPNDYYSWSVATSWSAKEGVLSRHFGKQKLTNKEAVSLVNKKLPHRTDDKKGYVSMYNSGNRLWEMKIR